MNSLLTSADPSTNTGEDSKSSESSLANQETNAEQEFCLYELETLSDSSSIGLVLRAIYDSGDVHKFTRALEKRITHYDKSILRVCTHHYQGFLDSLKQLRGLKEKCAEIRGIAEETNKLMQEESRELLKRSSEIVKYRRLQRNANAAIQQISMCLPMLESYGKLEKLMEQKKFYQALKILEDLEHNYLNQLHKYRFTHQFAKSFGPIRDQIRTSSYSELTDFLEDLMKKSEQIGEDACKYTLKCQSKLSADLKNTQANEKTPHSISDSFDITLSEDGSLIKKTDNSNLRQIKENIQQAQIQTQFNRAQIKHRIDLQDNFFGPIEHCCQIFNVLGERDNFEVHYRKQRNNQIQLILERRIPSINTVEVFSSYLYQIIGFFLIEDRIAQIQSTLITEEYKAELWELALQRITDEINRHFCKCIDVDLMFDMKNLLLLFARTTKNYGYNPTAFYNLLQNFRDRYNEILIKKYCLKFKETLEKDEYTPICVKDVNEYQDVINSFPVYKRGMDHEPFPRKFAFSRFVPNVYDQAKIFIKSCISLMEELQLSRSEVSDTCRRYLNILMTRWSDELKQFISGKKLSLVQLVQITINMGYLDRSCDFLERVVVEEAHKLTEENTGNGSNLSVIHDSGHLVTLKNQLFRDSRSDVEQLIDEAFREKVQVFLDNSNYDWTLQHPTGVASDYISDMITFLTTTFVSFTNLPAVLARHICMQTCKFLAEQLHTMLLSPEHKAVSMGALEQFSLDVMQCELFTAQCPVPGFEDNALAITFAHLRQLLDLVMGPDWTTFFAERNIGAQQKNNSVGMKYSRVKASNAAILLEKIVEYEKRNAAFFAIGRGDRNKLYDTILKKLRTFPD